MYDIICITYYTVEIRNKEVESGRPKHHISKRCSHCDILSEPPTNISFWIMGLLSERDT